MKIRTCILLALMCLLSTGLTYADDTDGPPPPCCNGLGVTALSFPSTVFTYQGSDPGVPDSPLAPFTFEFQYPGLPPDYVTVLGYSYDYEPLDRDVSYLGTYHIAFGLWSSVEYGGNTDYTELPGGWIVPAADAVPEPSTLALFGAGFLLLSAVGATRLRRWSASHLSR